MALPWLRLFNVALDVTNFAIGRMPRRQAPERELVAVGGRTSGQLEAHLGGVVVAALKEAFNRDSSRLELEREQMERERQRAERALKLELLRQAGEREIGRLRMMTGVAFASLAGTLLFSPRVMGGAMGARVVFGGGWVLLLAALSLSFTAQSNVNRAMARMDDAGMRPDDLVAGTATPWLIVAGLGAAGIAVLMV